jgi:hypothetical protein
VFRRPIVKMLARIVLATLVVLVLSSGAAASRLSVGETSQHGVVRVFLGSHQRITGLILQLRTRCTDHKHRDIWPGYSSHRSSIPRTRPDDSATPTALSGAMPRLAVALSSGPASAHDGRARI